MSVERKKNNRKGSGTNKRRSDAKSAEGSRHEDEIYTSHDRFSNFSERTEEKPKEDDYFSTRYGYTLTSEKERARADKPKKKAEPKKEKNYYKDMPKPKELTRKQRKRRTQITYVVTFFVIVAVAALLSFTVMFRTNEIIVENIDSVPYSDSEIIAQSGLKLRSNIFTSKKKLAVKNIVESFPYIEDAEVTFKIPGTQVIKLEPAIPSYEVAVNGGFAIISERGRVLEINKNQMSDIPLLKGLKVTDTEVGQYISFEKSSTQQILDEVISSINENNVPLIYGIDISNAASIKLNYDNRITILIGLPEDVGYKLRTAMAIINNELAATDKGNLDVSLANGDRKASYFTPIYSNTVSAESSTSSVSSASSASSQADTSSAVQRDYTDTPSSTIRKAVSSTTSENEQSSAPEEDVYDYYYEDDYYGNDYDDETQYEQGDTQNINGEYGTNYYY